MGRRRGASGSALIEIVIAIAILGIAVVPLLGCFVMAHRLNAKSDELMQEQLAVTGAVETLMAGGINEDDFNEDGVYIDPAGTDPDIPVRFAGVEIRRTGPEGDGSHWAEVVFSSGSVSVKTRIRVAA